jgi:hypothetical protein
VRPYKNQSNSLLGQKNRSEAQWEHCQAPASMPWLFDNKDAVASLRDLQALLFISLFSSISLLTTRTAHADNNVSTLLENCPPQTMQSTSEQSDRAMGLVKAAHSSWKGSRGSDTEATELRQEFEARLTELARPMGFKRSNTPAALSLQGHW